MQKLFSDYLTFFFGLQRFNLELETFFRLKTFDDFFFAPSLLTFFAKASDDSRENNC